MATEEMMRQCVAAGVLPSKSIRPETWYVPIVVWHPKSWQVGR